MHVLAEAGVTLLSTYVDITGLYSSSNMQCMQLQEHILKLVLNKTGV